MIASIKINNIRKYLGIYRNFNDAVNARKEAENAYSLSI